MSKYQVLQSNQNLMAQLGINSHQLKSRRNEFFKSIPAFLITFITISFTIISCAVFIYKNITNYESVIDAAMCGFAGMQGVGMFISIGLNMKNVKTLHLKLQEIVDEGCDDDVYAMYWATEQKCRKFTKFMCYYIFAHQSIVMASFFYSIYSICVGNLDTSTWVLAFNILVPFNTENLCGWYIKWVIQLSMSISYVVSVVSVTSYFVCCYFYIHAICDHFDLLINSIVHNDERTDERIHEKLTRAVDIHVKAFEVFRLIADINNGSVFSVILTCAVFLAMTMYNLEHSAFNAVSFVYHIVCVDCSIAWTAFYCYFATLATEQVSAVGDTVYNSNWYDYPDHMRKYVILMIARSQEPIHFTGFGLFGCTLEIFGKVLRSAVSYYIIFRKLSQH